MSHRTQTTLTDEQYERLRNEAGRSGLGLAELVRRAVDRSYGTADRRELLEALNDNFGCLAESDDDGAAFVACLRRGMARRLADP